MSDPTRPTPPPLPIIDTVPPELNKKQWICWQAIWDPSKEKWRKPPCSPVTGEVIGGTEKHRDHWQMFEEAIAGAKQHDLDGIGYPFLLADGYIGIDFDDCRKDGVLHQAVALWLDWFTNAAYVEVSPSGTGIHIICRGKLPGDQAVSATPIRKADGATCEMYSHSRYFTFTGQSLNGNVPIGDCQSGIDKLLTHLNVKETPASSAAVKNDKPISPSQVRQLYNKKLDELRSAPFGAGNATLNNTALIAARVCACGAFDKTEEQFKKELLDIVTKEWHSPHNANAARSTINSGWSKGASEGPFKLREYAVAVESAQYCAERPKEAPYIVAGMIYQGTASQLMGPIKEGKTTWLFAMIKNIQTGSDFIGQKTQPTNILYVTEQPRSSFQSQLARSGLDRDLKTRAAGLYVLDLGHLWNFDWSGRADTIRENAYKLDCGLVIIDTFPRIALVEEIQNAGEMNQRFEMIAPLVVADGRTLLMGWHERKAGGSISEAAAGTAASGGAVDMLLRLRRTPGSKLNDRTRQLELCGRLPVAFEESVAIVLNNEMSNYKCLGTKQAATRKNAEQQILNLLPLEPPGLTRDEIINRLVDEAMEEGLKPAGESTVLRALEKLKEDGLVSQSGTGKGGKDADSDPFRYHVAPPSF
jgi:AAA domain-containing protein